ncbi:MAG: phage tail sheath C-terminal domain-containing protein [Rhizomicrobium sp.]
MPSADFKQRKTPGVYVTELGAFPNSIPGVETAIPVFIGYTETAVAGTKPILFTPVLVNSLAAYQQYFGAGFEPKYLIQAPTEADPSYDVTAMTWDTTNSKYVATNYAITVQGPPTNTTTTVGDTTATVTEPSMPLASFNLYNSVRLFYGNGGGTCYIVSVGTYADATGPDGTSKIKPDDLTRGLAAAGEQVGPTITLIPDAVLLAADTGENASKTDIPVSTPFQTLTREMLTQSAKLQDRVALIDVYGTNSIDTTSRTQLDTDLDACISQFQTAVGEANLNYGMAYFPFLITSVVPPSEIDFTNFFVDPNKKDQLKTILTDQASYLYPDPAADDAAPAKNKNPTYVSVEAQITEAMKLLTPTTDAQWADVAKYNQNIVNAVPLLQQMENTIAYKMNLLPASGAMAGVCTLNDATRGVWNAPANMVLNQVIKPSVPINATQQGPLNAPINGKSVNVIRDFVGRGPVVWGARTLDGNSLDYRYVQVRRTLIYIESSVKTSLNQFVFAPNDGQTWVAVTAMVSAFLQNLWSQGGLMGDKASDAFSVQCGLGSTMTGTDVLNGYMIVQITLQMIHPAEFIELTFKQKMQGVS